MAKIRVYELAKKLNMTNKALLTKLKAMNIEVKSHMSSLEGETESQVRKSLFGQKTKQADTRVKPSVIRRRKPKRSKRRKKRKSKKNLSRTRQLLLPRRKNPSFSRMSPMLPRKKRLLLRSKNPLL